MAESQAPEPGGYARLEAALTDGLAAVQAELQGLRVEVERLHAVVDGDPQRDVTGLRKRMDTLETGYRALEEERRALNNKLKGIVIGLGLTGVTGAGTLVTLLTTLLGRTP